MNLLQRLDRFGQATDLNTQNLIEAIKWMAVRGYGFKVMTVYEGVDRGLPAGYDIKRD